jgi:phosphohistidine phosphatase
MTLLAVFRHAKSAYPQGVPDHDRPLSARGVADARVAGEWLREHVGVPDHVVVSTARRARGTWTVAAAPLGYIGAAGYDAVSPGPLTVDPRVYEATATRLLTVVRELPGRVRTAVLVGHLPGVGELVGLLAGSGDEDAAQRLADKYATCGIAVLEFPGGWPDLGPGDAYLRAFAVPRAVGGT